MNYIFSFKLHNLFNLVLFKLFIIKKMFSIFKKNHVVINSEDKIKEGFLEKESRVRKVWRQRWVVLTTKYLYTFEDKQIYDNPTETIDVNNFKTVKTDETKGGFAFVSK